VAARSRRPNALVLRAEAAAGGMRALARALGVSPSTVHRWRAVGPTAKGRELLHELGLRVKPKRPKRGAAGPVRPASQAVREFINKLERKSESSKKGWAKRRRKDRYQALVHQYDALESYHQNQTLPKRFVEVAKGLGLSLEETKGFWSAGAKGSLTSFLGVSASDIKKWLKSELKPSSAKLVSDVKTTVDEQCQSLLDEWIDIHAESGLQEDSKNKDRIAVLRNHISNNSAEFRRFMTAAQGLSFTTREAKDFWFSPSAIC
jgi:DNA-binding transcriptional MerR regulator